MKIPSRDWQCLRVLRNGPLAYGYSGETGCDPQDEEEMTMRHIGRVTVAPAKNVNNVDINGALDRVFAFVLDLIDLKGKARNATT